LATKAAPRADSFLPLSPVSFYILLALKDESQHGYAIMRSVRELTDGQVRLGSGTLYRAISSLLSADLVEETAPERPTYDDARRRYYRLTDLGRSVLHAEARRMEHAVRLTKAKRPQPRPT